MKSTSAGLEGRKIEAILMLSLLKVGFLGEKRLKHRKNSFHEGLVKETEPSCNVRLPLITSTYLKDTKRYEDYVHIELRK